MNEWNRLTLEQREQILNDHKKYIIISECGDCKEPMSELQWYMTLDDIPGVCPMCVEKAVKASMGIEDDIDDDWDLKYRI